MPVEFLVRAILIASLALFTSACGGGGGGSDAAVEQIDTGSGTNTGENEDNSEDEANAGEEEAIPPFIATQHELLPLIENTTIAYDDGKSLEVTKSTALPDETTDIYAVNYGDITQFFSSTPEQILLHGVDGVFSIPDNAPATNISFNTIRFSPPILIWKKEQDIIENQIEAGGTATATLTARVLGLPITRDISATILDSSTSQWTANQTLTSAIGQFQSKKIVIAINLAITIPELSSEVFSFLLRDTLNLVPGIGIISRDVDYTNGQSDDSALKFTHTISAINELPHPITFVKSGASPAPSPPEDTTNETYDQDRIFNFSNNGTNISSELYDITNMIDINTAGWINITKDNINKNYTVDILVNENTPVSSTSALVMFEHKISGQELPANINLIANP